MKEIRLPMPWRPLSPSVIKSDDPDDPRATTLHGWMLWCLEAEAERDRLMESMKVINEQSRGYLPPEVHP